MKTWLSVLLVLFLAISGCTQESQEPAAPSSAMPVPGSEGVDEHIVVSGSDGIDGNAVASETDEVVAGGVKEFTVTASQFSFNPETIRVKEGDTVRLIVTAMDVAHGIAIPEFEVNSGAIDAGETKTVEFVANKKGTYTFFCSVFCGSGHKSMKGTLIVE